VHEVRDEIDVENEENRTYETIVTNGAKKERDFLCFDRVEDWMGAGRGVVDCVAVVGQSLLLVSVDKAEFTSATTLSKARTQSIVTNGHSSLVPSMKWQVIVSEERSKTTWSSAEMIHVDLSRKWMALGNSKSSLASLWAEMVQVGGKGRWGALKGKERERYTAGVGCGETRRRCMD
jgi:hypothetical protein